MSEEPDASPEPTAEEAPAAEEKASPPPISPGLSVIGLLATGVAGIVVGCLGDGLALLASALSFGIVAWIAFR